MQVAQEILNQLGGRRFTVMTGAKNFVGGESMLQFDLPKSHKVRITLTPADLYKVELFKWNRARLEMVPVAEEDGIYNDCLQASFTRLTGLETRL